MRCALVVNPTSGRRRGDQVAAAARESLLAAGHTVTEVRGDDGPHARERLKLAIDDGLDCVVVVGGDGALNAILDLVAGSELVLGLLPAGTGNDTARALGIPVRDARAALDVLLRGEVRTIDLAHVRGPDTPGTNIATVVASGFDSLVNERANAMTWPRGNQRYNLAILAELRAFTPLSFTLDLDGDRLETEAMLVAVGNGPSYGGGLRLCEGARIDDGLLDVCIIRPVSKAKLVRVFPRLYRGTHITLPEFERYRVREVTVTSPGIVAYGDGERLGPLPLTTTVRPGALRVVAPPSP